MVRFIKFICVVCEIKRFAWGYICIFHVVYIAQSQSFRLQRIDPEERQIHDTKVGAASFRGVLKLASYNTLSQDRKMRSRSSRCIPSLLFFVSSSSIWAFSTVLFIPRRSRIRTSFMSTVATLLPLNLDLVFRLLSLFATPIKFCFRQMHPREYSHKHKIYKIWRNIRSYKIIFNTLNICKI